MAFEIRKNAASHWLDMPDGVRLHVKHYSSVIESQAEAWAIRHMRALAEGSDTAEMLGLTPEDDGTVAADLSRLMRDTGVAVHAIIEWTGVLDAGQPAELTPYTVWNWMMDPVNRACFLGTYDANYREARSEGNVSGPLPNGISAMALNTAVVAGTMDSPAQRDGAVPMESFAPIQNTIQ